MYITLLLCSLCQAYCCHNGCKIFMMLHLNFITTYCFPCSMRYCRVLRWMEGMTASQLPSLCETSLSHQIIETLENKTRKIKVQLQKYISPNCDCVHNTIQTRSTRHLMHQAICFYEDCFRITFHYCSAALALLPCTWLQPTSLCPACVIKCRRVMIRHNRPPMALLDWSGAYTYKV